MKAEGKHEEMKLRSLPLSLVLFAASIAIIGASYKLLIDNGLMEPSPEFAAATVLVCAGTDGTQAMLHTDRIATGLRLRKVHPGLVYKSGLTAQAQVVPQHVLNQCEEIGATLAAGVAAGIY